MSESKHCSKCGEVKALEEFGNDRSRIDGHYSYCKRCRLRDPCQSDEVKSKKALGLFKCTTCKQWLERDRFYSNPSNPYREGLHNECRDCAVSRVKGKYHAAIDVARQKGREAGARSKERIKVKNRTQYLKRHQQNPERSRRWHQKNYDRIRDHRIEYLRNWCKTERAKQIALRNIHKRRTAEGTYTPEEWKLILDACGRICLRCLTPESESIYAFRQSGPLRGKLTVDHVIPVTKNGTSFANNLQPLCLRCQLWKRDKPIDFRPLHVRQMLLA